MNFKEYYNILIEEKEKDIKPDKETEENKKGDNKDNEDDINIDTTEYQMGIDNLKQVYEIYDKIGARLEEILNAYLSDEDKANDLIETVRINGFDVAIKNFVNDYAINKLDNTDEKLFLSISYNDFIAYFIDKIVQSKHDELVKTLEKKGKTKNKNEK